MSATFNYELFANYFSKSSVKSVDGINVYEGRKEMYEKEEEERKKRESSGWGPANSTNWDSRPMDEED